MSEKISRTEIPLINFSKQLDTIIATAQKHQSIHLILPEGFTASQVTEWLQQLRNKMPDHTIIDVSRYYARTEKPSITILKVISRAVVVAHKDLITQAMQAYVARCEELKKAYTDQTISDAWYSDKHGEYCLFIHNSTAEKIEVPVEGDIKEIDPYFFGEWIHSVPKFSALATLIHDTYHDSARILDIMYKRPLH
jgi:transcriptional regulator of heat shock response